MPLYLRLRNTTDRAVETTLRLRATDAIRAGDLALLEKPIFIQPFGTRWETFYPYVVSDAFTWSVEYDAGGRNWTFTLPQFRVVAPATVFLDRLSLAAGRHRLGVARFPESLFPPMVTATDALHAVLIDHVPRWTVPQATAFGQWIRRGGMVHLLESPGGAALAFPSKLAFLATNAPRTAFGGGLIIRHAASADRVTGSDVAAWQGLGPPDGDGRGSAGASASNGTPTADRAKRGVLTRGVRTGSDTGIWARLGQLHRLRRRWGSIYAIALAYVFALFPLVWLLRHHRRPLAAVYAGLLVSVLVASVGFAWVAPQRGETDSAEVHFAVLARVLDRDTLDCTFWGDVFVAPQTTLVVRAPGDQQLYGVHTAHEPVASSAVAGRNGRLTLRVPPFSSRQLICRYRVRQKVPEIRIVRFETLGERLQTVELAIDGEADSSSWPLDWSEAAILYGGHLYRGTHHAGRLTLGAPQGTVTSVLHDDQASETDPADDPDSRRSSERVFTTLRKSLLVRALDLPTLESSPPASPGFLLVGVPLRRTPAPLMPQCTPPWSAAGCTLTVYRIAVPGR